MNILSHCSLKTNGQTKLAVAGKAFTALQKSFEILLTDLVTSLVLRGLATEVGKYTRPNSTLSLAIPERKSL